MFFLALKHLFSRKKQTFLTLLGITLGTTAYVVISGFMLGFRAYFLDQLINNDAHIRISAKESFLEEHALDRTLFPTASHVFWISIPSGRKDNARIEHPAGWYHRLDQDPTVVAYTPQLSAQIIISKGQSSTTAKLLGTHPRQHEKVTTIGRYVTQGTFHSIGNSGIAVGDDLLKKIGAHMGDTVLVSNGRSKPTPVRVVCTFKVGIKPLDEGTVFGSLADVQKINHTPSQVNEIAVSIKDPTQAAAVATHWSQTTEEKVQSWDQLNESLLAVFKIQDAIRFLMTLSILIVAGFSIYNILNMVVSQKRKDIAILRSMGFEKNDILKLFLIQGVILGFWGGLIGLFIGFLASLYLETLPFVGGPLGSGTGHMLVSFESKIYIFGFLFSFFASALASIFPARLASTLTPIDIIRSET
ncbi:MAG: ABC transporter permease [Candidatus Margulisiibacteriota bacterium]